MASVYEQILARQRGQGSAPHPTRTSQPGFNPQTGALDPGPVGGFLASALSAFPEFLGADPMPVAAAFRAEHPWLGFASELPALTVPYAGAFRLSRIPALAAGLERTVARVADPVLRPIVAGTTREIVRYAPLEASRLAIGGIIHPDNFGELFADVAFSTAIAGGIGAVGGIFRAGGAAGRTPEARVVNAPITASSTLQLQLLRAGGEVADPALGREAAERLLIDDIFSEVSGTGAASRVRLPTVHSIDGASAEDTKRIFNSAFRVNDPPAAGTADTGLRSQLLRETEESNVRTLNPGQQEEIVAGLRANGANIADVTELAESTLFPRHLLAPDTRGARELAQLLDHPAMHRVNDNTWFAREGGDGLHVGVMLLPEPTVAAGAGRRARAQGAAKVRPGRRALLFKTNVPGRFAPQQQALLDSNYASWATWRQAYQEPVYELTRLGAEENAWQRLLSPQDFKDLHRKNRQTWISDKARDATRAFTGDNTLTDSAIGRAWAETAYDAISPTMFKQGKNTLYGRFTSTQTARLRAVTREVNRNFLGETTMAGNLLKHIHRKQFKPAHPEGTYTSNVNAIADEDWGTFIKAAITQTPADDLAKLADNGVVRAETVEAVRNLQALKRRYDTEFILPELQAAGQADKVSLLEGYIMPTPRLGDHLQAVMDEGGTVRQILSGKNALHAQRQADVIVEEAKRQGLEWSSERMLQAAYEPGDIDKLFSDTIALMQKDEPAQNIIQAAMRRLSYIAHPSASKEAFMGVRQPGFLKERSGLTTFGDLPTKREVLQQMYSHEVRLGNYAAMQGWTERWGGELTRYEKFDPTLARDVLRKRDQHLGIEGKITNTLNTTLQPVLGNLMGPKPATRIAELVNKTMFKFNLAWFNPTFSLLNGLTPLMTGLPEIAFVLKGSRAAVSSHYDFLPAYGADGAPLGTSAIISPLKILWQGVRDLRRPTPEQQQLIRELTEDGSLASHLPLEYLGAGAKMPSALNAAYGRSYLEGADAAASYMATRSEEFSRILSALMGHRLGQVIGVGPDSMKAFVRKYVENTNYLYGVTDRPRIFTGPAGSMFGLFKNWQMHYMGMMTHYAGVAWKEGVYSPLLWQSSAALAIGGLGATPLRHLADGISNWFGNDPQSYRWMMENWPGASDEIWYGLPSFLGVSLQTSAAIPGTDVRNEITSLGSIVAWERAKQIGLAVGSAISHSSATGENAWENPNVRDQMLSALTPRVISRAVSTTEGDYVRSMRTGYPQVREVEPRYRLMHALGMNTVEIDRQQHVARELWRDQERRRALITGLGSSYAQAQLRGDNPEMEQIIQRSIILGLELSKVMQSANNFERRETESDSLSRFDRMEAARAMAALDQAGQ